MAKNNPAQALQAAQARLHTQEATIKRLELEKAGVEQERDAWKERSRLVEIKALNDVDVRVRLHKDEVRTAKLDVVRWRLVSVTLALVLGATILGVVL